ncbi:SRPBCC family protein [bacterium]|nr:SRPBCC family protein [bacterium]
MNIEQSITIASSPENIFAIYKDVDSWAQWDPDIEAVGMDGDFVAGTTGWLKPVGAPKTATKLTSVSEPTAFTVEAKLPLCTMHFEHDLKVKGDKTQATHRVIFSGPMAPVFSRLIGGKIRKGIDGTMHGLKKFAEA